MSPYLQVENLSVAFGGVKALTSVACAVQANEIFGVIGPNGAGKTTLFNCIAGVRKPTAGSVVFQNERLSGRSVDAIARRGVGRTFQAATVFNDGSVLDNMCRAGDFAAHPSPTLMRWFGLDSKSERAAIEDEAARALDFIGIADLAASPAHALSYGHQKILGLGMALMTNPKMLLMDEPAAGLNSSEKVGMKGLIAKIRRERGITVLVVEHDMSLIMDICDRVMVLNQGAVIATGTPADIQGNSDVIDAYLGVDHGAA